MHLSSTIKLCIHHLTSGFLLKLLGLKVFGDKDFLLICSNGFIFRL
ncbi:hypothetical protein SeSPB_A1754 [Salmonella enterica subsp. enterica serovar Saintpaul str. SARA29]|nr:hypothetical protein SeSPB_A1754 [Salmonella enterica subsp. enterica serovar Saintpaul str. SARA29]